jgi:hypothetical protein
VDEHREQCALAPPYGNISVTAYLTSGRLKMAATPLFIQLLGWLCCGFSVSTVLLLLCFCIVCLSQQPFECSKFYYGWVCLGNCGGMNISQGFCTPKGHMPLSFVPYSGILNCSQHVGQHGYDARLVSNLLVLITVPVGLAFSASIIFGIVSSSRIRILHMKLVLCVSAGDGFYQFGKLILNICDILKEAGPANPFSPESSLFFWIKQFGLYFGFSWHTAIITSVFLMGRYPVLFLKPKHQSRIFAISCAAVWSLTLFMAGNQTRLSP